MIFDFASERGVIGFLFNYSFLLLFFSYYHFGGYTKLAGGRLSLGGFLIVGVFNRLVYSGGKR